MKPTFWKIIEMIILSITAFMLGLSTILTTLTLTEFLIASAISFSIFILDLIYGKATGNYVLLKGKPVKLAFSKSTPKKHVFIYKLYFFLVIITIIIVSLATIFLLSQ